MPIALFLAKKYREACKYLPRISNGLDVLEKGIEKKYGVDKLDEMKAQESDFKKKVLEMKYHKDLVNPYDLPRPSGKSCCSQSDIRGC